MRNYMLGALAAVAVAVLVPACQQSADPGLPLEDFESDSNRAYCEKVLRCGGVFALRYGGDLDTCLAARSASAGLSPANILAAGVADGRVFYDARAAADCLADYAVGECDPLGLGGWPYCSAIGQGLVGVGETCTQDMMCASGWCDLTSQCPGVCGEPLPPDSACEYTVPCAWHQACIDWQCVTFSTAILKQGDACDGNSVSGLCAYGLSCDTVRGSCQPLPAMGEPCAWTYGCAPGLVCSDSGACQPVSSVSAAGQACDDNIGPFCDWSAGLGCRRDLDLAQWLDCVPFAQQGEPCEVFDTERGAQVSIPCDPTKPLRCDASGSCSRLGEPGAPCTTPSECLSKICDTDTSQCVAYAVDRCVPGTF